MPFQCPQGREEWADLRERLLGKEPGGVRTHGNCSTGEAGNDSFSCLPQHGRRVAAARLNADSLAAVDGAFLLLCLDGEEATARAAADVARHYGSCSSSGGQSAGHEEQGEEDGAVTSSGRQRSCRAAVAGQVCDYALFEDEGASYASDAGKSRRLSLDAALRQALHGDMRNRWFDKSLSLVVSSGGACGMAFEVREKGVVETWRERKAEKERKRKREREKERERRRDGLLLLAYALLCCAGASVPCSLSLWQSMRRRR